MFGVCELELVFVSRIDSFNHHEFDISVFADAQPTRM